MIEPSKYDEVNRLARGHLARHLNRRRERGDSYADIAFWVRSRYGIPVSHELVRQWCQQAATSVVE